MYCIIKQDKIEDNIGKAGRKSQPAFTFYFNLPAGPFPSYIGYNLMPALTTGTVIWQRLYRLLYYQTNHEN